MSKKPKDRFGLLEEKVKKLNTTIRTKDRVIKQLKSQVQTVELAWKKTEMYLNEVTNGKPLSEVLKAVEAGRPLSKIGKACPNCGTHNMNKILFIGFYIITCDCGYRNKVDEEQEISEN